MEIKLRAEPDLDRDDEYNSPGGRTALRACESFVPLSTMVFFLKADELVSVVVIPGNWSLWNFSLVGNTLHLASTVFPRKSIEGSALCTILNVAFPSAITEIV